MDEGRMLPSYPESKRRALARNVLENTLLLKRGENLLIETWTPMLEWAESFVLEARIIGARPLLIVEGEETLWESVKEAPAAHVGRAGSHEWAALKESDAHVYLYGPLDREKEEALPRSIVGRIEADSHEWFRLVEKYGVRSARFDLGRTSEFEARRYGVDLAEWRRQLVEAATVDPRTLQKDGARIARLLKRGREVSITHPNGTDLTFELKHRDPRVDDGVIDSADLRAGNVATVVPSGVVGASVDETRGDGTFVGNVAGVLLSGSREVPLHDGRWTFRRGRLTEYSHGAGGAAFDGEYRRVGPGKERPGVVSIGLNTKISEIPLLFDQQYGTISISVGRNAYFGGVTRTPHFTAYQSIRGGTLSIDGVPVVADGKLVAPKP